MENGEDRSGGLLAEIVFLIHGTGAGIADEAAPRWWQTDSTFARKLSEAVGNQRDGAEEQAADVMKLIDRLEEDDDVQAVYHNMDED